MKRQCWLILLLALALMAMTAGFLQQQSRGQKLGTPGVKLIAEPSFDTEGNLVASNSVYLPPAVLNYKSEIRAITSDTLRWLPKDTTYGQRLYTGPDGFQSALNVVLMGSDRTSIHRPEWCLSGVGWSLDPQELASVQISKPHSYELPLMKLTASRESLTSSGEKVRQRVVYAYWFVADGELTARPGQRMRWMARDMLLRGVLQRWAYVACIGYCAPGQEESTFNRMKELIAAAVPQFQLATGEPAPVALNR
jgi:hypothetical protein